MNGTGPMGDLERGPGTDAGWGPMRDAGGAPARDLRGPRGDAGGPEKDMAGPGRGPWRGPRKDVGLREQLPMIKTIIFRDVGSSWWQLIVTLVFSIVVFSFMFALFYNDPWMHYRQPDWSESAITEYFGLAVLVSGFGFIIAYISFYSMDVRRGTIRSLTLYPMNLNGIIIAKLISSSIVGSLGVSMVYLALICPFIAVGHYSMGGALLLLFSAMNSVIFIMVVTAFGSNIIIKVFKTLKFTGSGLFALFFALSILFTEFVGTTIGYMFTEWHEVARREAVRSTMEWLSPWTIFHAAGQWNAWVLLGRGDGIDFWLVIPLGIAIVIGGYLCGRKVYLDILAK